MAVSKKKPPKSTKPAPHGKHGSVKRREAPHGKTATRGTPASFPSTSASKKRPLPARKPAPPTPPTPLAPPKGETVPRAGSGLESALREAREQIRRLMEERKNQAALIDAADLEREILQKQVDELQEKLRQQSQQWHSESGKKSKGDQELDLEFAEDEEDADEGTEGGQVDEVDEIYQRMDDPRVRRQELDRERIDRESEAGDEPYWLVCPKCGDNLEEVETEDVKLERCEGCGGIYLDRGEVEMLLALGRGPRGLRRIRNVLQI